MKVGVVAFGFRTARGPGRIQGATAIRRGISRTGEYSLASAHAVGRRVSAAARNGREDHGPWVEHAHVAPNLELILSCVLTATAELVKGAARRPWAGTRVPTGTQARLAPRGQALDVREASQRRGRPRWRRTPKTAAGAKTAADAKIMDRCLHPAVHNDPRSLTETLTSEITARSARATT